MRAMNALGRGTLYLQMTWAARGAGITGTAAALFAFPLEFPNHYYDLSSTPRSQYS
jgi:hypothetical protein